MKEALAQVSENLEEILSRYDEAAQELLRVARADGHFAGWNPDDVAWPCSPGPGQVPGPDALARRAALIAEIYDGTPSRRDSRLGEAYERYSARLPAYHESNRLFARIQRQFRERGAGDERDFLQLYQTVYLEALRREDPVPLDEGEAALVEFRVARAPLALATSVAEKVHRDADPDDPRWTQEYSCTDAAGNPRTATLRDHLTGIAEAVVDMLAAGEHLAVRFNTFSNFIWFGISIWKAVTDLDLLVSRLRGKVRRSWLEKLELHVRLAQGMLLEFLQAHLEDPAQIRPREYWYGQQYSYLTRDMIDLVTALIPKANALRRRARGGDEIPPVEVPLLFLDDKTGRFLEYPGVGTTGTISVWKRRARLLAWLRLFRQARKVKLSLWRPEVPEQVRIEKAWKCMLDMGSRVLDLFGIELEVTVDPLFEEMARELRLGEPGARKVAFLPTHLSLLDHPVMYGVLQSPQLCRAMGWEGPRPCTILSRERLLDATAFRIGGREFSLIGITPDRIDTLSEEVDGYVILRRSKDTGNPTQRFAEFLEQRPGVVYGAGTVAAYALQILPMQHALFAYLPQDTVIVPLAFRGIHQVWPKCPRGNLDINPGRVEVVVSPPMLGETTLLPRKRALRTQLEPATLFQAVHIATLLNPEPAEPSASAT